MKSKFVIVASCLFILMMVMLPSITETGTKTAIIIWANSIVPVLLPFFIFSEFIKNAGDLHKLSPKTYPFVIAFLSGYPMGAKVVGDFIRGNTVTKEQGKRILSYSLVTGPAFIIFTIGSFLNDTKAAVIVAIAHYFGAFINKNFYYTTKNEIRAHVTRVSKNDYMECFSQAITSGFRAMAVILAYLIFFTIGINMIEHVGVFSVINNDVLNSILKGGLEMTIGINYLGLCDASIKLKTIIASVLVSFGGLSVIGQSASMLKGTSIGFKDILEIKFTHALIAGIVATLLVNNVVL